MSRSSSFSFHNAANPKGKIGLLRTARRMGVGMKFPAWGEDERSCQRLATATIIDDL